MMRNEFIVCEVNCSSGTTVYRKALPEEVDNLNNLDEEHQSFKAEEAAQIQEKQRAINALAESHPEVHKALTKLGVLNANTE